MKDREIFSKIWTQPREVFNYILENNYKKYMIVLLFLAGIVRTLDRASMRDYGDRYSLMVILGMSILLGGLLGWISYYIYAALIRWTGSWLDGQGDTDSIFRVMAYALLPNVLGLFLVAPQILVYGIEIFKSNGDITSAGVLGNIIFYTCLIAEIVLSIYTIVFIVIAISVVQKLSIGKSILNLLLPIVIIAIPIGLIVFLLK